jgi:hypothetical protein
MRLQYLAKFLLIAENTGHVFRIALNLLAVEGIDDFKSNGIKQKCITLIFLAVF